jgi:hypothetical protein
MAGEAVEVETGALACRPTRRGGPLRSATFESLELSRQCWAASRANRMLEPAFQKSAALRAADRRERLSLLWTGFARPARGGSPGLEGISKPRKAPSFAASQPQRRAPSRAWDLDQKARGLHPGLRPYRPAGAPDKSQIEFLTASYACRSVTVSKGTSPTHGTPVGMERYIKRSIGLDRNLTRTLPDSPAAAGAQRPKIVFSFRNRRVVR